ncbi:MAG: peptide-methionine (S)-S-oxide reductase MsrA [Burkholderiales bacterium]|nr:peptide-methionine (S)-S-oxide reductase MsrA [Phycisphaerae bacterium]
MNRTLIQFGIFALLLTSTACTQADVEPAKVPSPAKDVEHGGKGTANVVLAGGCFWCTEAVFERVPGVTNVVSGYAGGTKESAEYAAVSAGKTDHAEVIQVTYDPSKISYGQLLRIFFSAAHDPTQLNRQGPDSGRQYRSTIFYAGDEQKSVAEAYIKQLNDAKVFDKPIATTLESLAAFYPAEAYHQDYAKVHPDDGYLKQNLPQKLEKLAKALKQ